MFPAVRRQTTVSARPREDRAVRPAQKNTAIADIAHPEVIIASQSTSEFHKASLSFTARSFRAANKNRVGQNPDFDSARFNGRE